jgi:hypothetical protein
MLFSTQGANSAIKNNSTFLIFNYYKTFLKYPHSTCPLLSFKNIGHFQVPSEYQ